MVELTFNVIVAVTYLITLNLYVLKVLGYKKSSVSSKFKQYHTDLEAILLRSDSHATSSTHSCETLYTVFGGPSVSVYPQPITSKAALSPLVQRSADYPNN